MQSHGVHSVERQQRFEMATGLGVKFMKKEDPGVRGRVRGVARGTKPDYR